MSNQLGEALVPIRATLDKLDGDLAKARGKVEGAIDKIGKNLQSIGKIAIGGAIAGITAIGLGIGLVSSKAIPAASDLNEALNASTVVFGEASGKIQEFGQIASDTAGLSAREFNQMAAETGSMLLNFGLDVNTAADSTIDLTQRAADMASIFNTDVGDALSAIQSGLQGQSMPLRRFGVDMSDAAIRAQALEMGLGDITRQSDSTAYTQASLALLFKQTDRIAGDFVNTSGDLANATRVNQARWENFMAQVGKVGLPIMTTMQSVLMSVGEKVFPIVISALETILPIVQGVADAFGTFVGNLLDGVSPLDAVKSLIYDLGAALGINKETLDGVVSGLQGVIDFVQQVIDTIKPYLEMAWAWISQNIELKDVLIALGIAIATVVLPVIWSLIASVAPIILTFMAVVAVVALLRKAWESNFLGIQDKTKAAWEFIQPLLQSAWEWLKVNVPAALEVLRSFWVEKAWPAIQNAIQTVWPIIENIFATIKDWILNTLIPTIINLYTEWKDKWETAQTVLQNVWTIVSEIFAELGRWINDNIVPWIEYLQKKWAEDVWPAIQGALESAWDVIRPIWEKIQDWLEEKLPPAIEGLKGIFEGAMSAISSAVQPVKDLWDRFVNAVQGFWDWISGKVFNFKINLPNLPSWALPGSPLPIHTAWKDFAREMDRMTIRPQFDLDRLLPAMTPAADAAGTGVGNTYHQYYQFPGSGFTPESQESIVDRMKLFHLAVGTGKS